MRPHLVQLVTNPHTKCAQNSHFNVQTITQKPE